MKTLTKSLPKGYRSFIENIKSRIRAAQYEALKAVNKELIALYWDIGRRIAREQKKRGWGKSVVDNLALDLQKEFPGIKGFSSRNIWYMRNFYSMYSDNPILQPMVAEIGWTHNVIIMDRCHDDAEREFYISMTKKFGWTKNVLIHQIENQSYEKRLSNQTNFDKTVSAQTRTQAKTAVKDEYTFDFLELDEDHQENELERGLMKNIRRFLLEMGGHFCFVSNQHRIEIDGQLTDFEDLFDRAYTIKIDQFDERISEVQAKQKLEDIQKELDEKVYKLYGLTEQEIPVVENLGVS